MQNVCIQMNETNKCGFRSLRPTQTTWFVLLPFRPNVLPSAWPHCTLTWWRLITWFRFIPWLLSLFLFFFTTFREPSRSLEPGQCHQPDIVVQTVHARLQRGGIMQHHQGFAGHCRASGRDAGVYAAARGVLGWVLQLRRLPDSQGPSGPVTWLPALPLPCTLVFGQGPSSKQNCVAYKKGQSCAQNMDRLFGLQRFCSLASGPLSTVSQ